MLLVQGEGEGEAKPSARERGRKEGRGGQQGMANLDEQLWRACHDRDWAQAAFLLEAGAGTEWRDEEEDGDTAIVGC